MASELLPCSECPRRQEWVRDPAPELRELTDKFIPLVGESVVEGFIADEQQLSQQITAAEARCPGYKPMGKWLRRLVKLVDGQPGIEFSERMGCHNPLSNNADFQKETEKRREAFRTLVVNSTEESAKAS